MDVVILAGGQGSRLAMVWDGPKCLAPFAGVPILTRLFDHIAPLRPRIIHLLLGHKATDVMKWLVKAHPSVHVNIFADYRMLGTCGSVRAAAGKMEAPVLIINGDTLPGYEFGQLVQFYETVKPKCAAAWCGEHYAGAMVIGYEVLGRIRESTQRDFDPSLFSDAARYRVPSFFDIGTPENFNKAQHMKGDNL